MAVSQLAPLEELNAHRSMLTVRRFEEPVLELCRDDVCAGPVREIANRILFERLRGLEAAPAGA